MRGENELLTGGNRTHDSDVPSQGPPDTRPERRIRNPGVRRPRQAGSSSTLALTDTHRTLMFDMEVIVRPQ